MCFAGTKMNCWGKNNFPASEIMHTTYLNKKNMEIFLTAVVLRRIASIFLSFLCLFIIHLVYSRAFLVLYFTFIIMRECLLYEAVVESLNFLSFDILLYLSLWKTYLCIMRVKHRTLYFNLFSNMILESTHLC